jgi:hypothetical protein
MIKLCCITLLFCIDCLAYNSENLPLSKPLRESFPKLKVSCFIIVSDDAKIVIHEQNSKHKIQINDQKNKVSLYELICSSHKAFEKSKISGTTIVFTYANKHNCNFTIAVSGINNFDDFEEDKKKITEWLDQFFKVVVYNEGDHIETLPIIFGGAIKTIDMIADREIIVILSSLLSNRITKRVIYKGIVPTPIDSSTELGNISLHTPTFQNPSIIHIKSTEEIRDGSKCEIILDSIMYLIFGVNYAKKT